MEDDMSNTIDTDFAPLADAAKTLQKLLLLLNGGGKGDDGIDCVYDKFKYSVTEDGGSYEATMFPALSPKEDARSTTLSISPTSYDTVRTAAAPEGNNEHSAAPQKLQAQGDVAVAAPAKAQEEYAEQALLPAKAPPPREFEVVKQDHMYDNLDSFGLLDVNSDGWIAREELIEGLQMLDPATWTDSRLNGLLGDTGSISASAFGHLAYGPDGEDFQRAMNELESPTTSFARSFKDCRIAYKKRADLVRHHRG